MIVRRAAAASSRSDDGSNADSCAERGAGGDDLGGEGDEPLRNAALLSQLLAALDAGGAPSVASLTSRGAPCEGARSLRFMQWLSDREDEGEGGGGGGGGEGEGGGGGGGGVSCRSSPLSRLGEVLTVLREGLHATAFEELQEALAAAIAEAEAADEEGGTEGRTRLLLAEQQGLLSAPSPHPAGAEGGEEGGDGAEDAVDALVAQRWRALAAARSGGGLGSKAGGGGSSPSLTAAAALSLSLSRQGLAAAQRRASSLSEGVNLQRARSAMELMGRVRTRRSGDGGEGGAGEAEEGRNDGGPGTETGALPLAPASPSPPPHENLSPLPAEAAVAAALAGDPAPRILALLLEEPDPSARAALLPDAFDAGGGESPDAPAAARESERGEAEVDFVFTTPLKLVQAIDLELGRLERAAASGGSRGGTGGGEGFATPPLFLPGRGPAAAPAGGEELVAVLEDLRQRAMEFV